MSAPAQSDTKPTAPPAKGIVVPRFVTLKKDTVYMRRGPGVDNPIIWQYERRHFPVEVVNEYQIWREVRDVDGTQGWISVNMLSSDRYVLVLAHPGDKTNRWPLHRRADAKSPVIALAEPGVIGALKHCPDDWCQIVVGRYTGWIERAAVWGVLPGERVE